MSDLDLQIRAADAMAALGIRPRDERDILLDSRLCRFSCETDNAQKKNGWAIVFRGDRDVLVFGHWSQNIPAQTVVLSNNRPGLLSPAEREAIRVGIEAAQRNRDSEMQARQKKAQRQQSNSWGNAKPANDLHPYLVRKGVKAHGLRDNYGTLLVPMRDIDGVLWSCQSIRVDGRKEFPFGGRVKGLFCRVGPEPQGKLIVAEGWATAAALFETTDTTCYAALSAGNLKQVAIDLRAKYPDIEIVIAADNDVETEKKTGRNPGVIAAEVAALAVGGKVAMPPEGFNDFADAKAGAA